LNYSCLNHSCEFGGMLKKSILHFDFSLFHFTRGKFKIGNVNVSHTKRKKPFSVLRNRDFSQSWIFSQFCIENWPAGLFTLVIGKFRFRFRFRPKFRFRYAFRFRFRYHHIFRFRPKFRFKIEPKSEICWRTIIKNWVHKNWKIKKKKKKKKN
jgi:hypothetical protein